MPDDDYVYDEDSGEWLPASELAAKRAALRQAQDERGESKGLGE